MSKELLPPRVIAPPPPKSKSKEFSYSESDLHDYQNETASFCVKNQKVMMWLDMGLGKTLIMLTTFVRLKRLGYEPKMLIVAPLRVCQLTWKQEAAKWDHTKHLKFADVYGSAKKKQISLFSNADIYLTNYESLTFLKNQLNHYFINQGLALPFNIVCFDEVSKMKRPQSVRFKDFAPITCHFDRCYGLTASPSSNGLQNLWSQYYVIDQGVRLGKYNNTFTSRFFKQSNGQYGGLHAYSNTRQLIINAISDITIQINSEDAQIELPELVIVNRLVFLKPKKMKTYLECEMGVALKLAEDREVSAFNHLAIMNILRQFASGAIYHYEDRLLFPEKRTVEFIHDEKLNELEHIIDESGGEPIFLAYQFTFEKEQILKKFKYAKCMTGATEEEALDLKNKFNNGDIKLLIAHTKSAGYGLNLQGHCRLVVMYGLPWSLEEFEQFIGRVSRQGNDSSKVMCICILTADTIDIDVSKRIEARDKDQRDLKDEMRDHLLSKYNLKIGVRK
jgi:SNF2 family DNA or RNA helicase